MVCGANKFCLQRAGDVVYCYGNEGGCLWNRGDCNSNADCSKYSYTRSFKYTDNRPCGVYSAGAWPLDACPPSATPSVTPTPTPSPDPSARPEFPQPWIPTLFQGWGWPWDIASDRAGGEGFYIVSHVVCVVGHFKNPTAGLTNGRWAAGRAWGCWHSGDGGYAWDATIHYPTGIAVFAPNDYIIANVRGRAEVGGWGLGITCPPPAAACSTRRIRCAA